MTDEEKQAIEYLKKYSIWNESQGFPKGKNDSAIETVLNLIKRRQREKELHIKLEQQYKKEYLDAKEEIEKYKYLYQKALDNTIKADRENFEKDKIIDEMAKIFIKSDYCFEITDHLKCNECINRNKEKQCENCIKEYFKKKVEDK